MRDRVFDSQAMSLLPVLCVVEHQRERALRLVKYCRALDGTDVEVIEIPKALDKQWQDSLVYPYSNNVLPCLCARSLHYTASRLREREFVWLETDSIPLRPGWLEEIERAYVQEGKPFLMSSDTHPPHDLCGGVVVFPKRCEWMIPVDLARHGWDTFLIRNLRPLLGFTPVIQHTYGVYDERGHAALHRFPNGRDERVRKDAVIFHKDQFQDLIP
jgi:hypothetical protein